MGEYTRTTYHGKTFNNRTVAMLKEMEKRLGYELTIMQGSYNSGVGASAGTHDGGGAVDLSANDWQNKVRVGRNIGFAIWHRPALSGVWPEHVHGIAIGDKEMSTGARAQVIDYYNHRDGLASHNYDSFYRPSPIPVFDYEEYVQGEWSRGPVYVSRLHYGVNNSDSVRRLQYRLARHKDVGRRVVIDGDYGDQTKAAVGQWQRRVAQHGPNNGSEITLVQANRLFGDAYHVKD